MTTRIGINGFGRMGRLALRAAWGWSEVEFVHVNETKGGAETAARLLTFDSVHGKWPREVTAMSDAIVIDGKAVAFTSHASPGEVPWKEHGVHIVLECTGKFRTPALLAPYFTAGVKKVIVAAPVKDGSAQRRRRRQRPSLRSDEASPSHGGVVHDHLPRARRKRHPRVARHSPRNDHDDPRHHQHADDHRRPTRTCAARARTACHSFRHRPDRRPRSRSSTPS